MSNTSNELPSWLDDLKKRGDGFQVPDGYFENLERSILDKTAGVSRGAQGETTMVVVAGSMRRPWYRRMPVLAAAAAVVGILAVAWWFMRPAGASNPAELSDEDLHAYILENAQEFELEQLASINPEHLPEASAQPAVPAAGDQQIQDEIHPEDLEHLLNDLSDEELEEIL